MSNGVNTTPKDESSRSGHATQRSGTEHDLSRSNVRDIAREVRPGDLVYAGDVNAIAVVAFRVVVERRALVLDEVGPFYFRVARRPVFTDVGVKPCVHCAGVIWCGRCRRCGTRPA